MNQRMRILVVEDTIVCQVGIKALLDDSNYQYTIVNTGEEAIIIADQYDLILMDLGLPGINGIDAAAAIRGKGIAVPIIALTAHGSKENIQACFQAGMNEFVEKPLSIEAVNKIFEQLSAH